MSDEYESNTGLEPELDISLPEETEEGGNLSDTDIDDILGKENTDAEGIGGLVDDTADTDYDPNSTLPNDTDFEYVRDKNGIWVLRKKKNRGNGKEKSRMTSRGQRAESESWDDREISYPDERTVFSPENDQPVSADISDANSGITGSADVFDTGGREIAGDEFIPGQDDSVRDDSVRTEESTPDENAGRNSSKIVEGRGESGGRTVDVESPENAENEAENEPWQEDKSYPSQTRADEELPEIGTHASRLETPAGTTAFPRELMPAVGKDLPGNGTTDYGNISAGDASASAVFIEETGRGDTDVRSNYSSRPAGGWMEGSGKNQTLRTETSESSYSDIRILSVNDLDGESFGSHPAAAMSAAAAGADVGDAVSYRAVSEKEFMKDIREAREYANTCKSQEESAGRAYTGEQFYEDAVKKMYEKYGADAFARPDCYVRQGLALSGQELSNFAKQADAEHWITRSEHPAREVFYEIKAPGGSFILGDWAVTQIKSGAKSVFRGIGQAVEDASEDGGINHYLKDAGVAAAVGTMSALGIISASAAVRAQIDAAASAGYAAYGWNKIYNSGIDAQFSIDRETGKIVRGSSQATGGIALNGFSDQVVTLNDGQKVTITKEQKSSDLLGLSDFSRFFNINSDQNEKFLKAWYKQAMPIVNAHEAVNRVAAVNPVLFTQKELQFINSKEFLYYAEKTAARNSIFNKTLHSLSGDSGFGEAIARAGSIREVKELIRKMKHAGFTDSNPLMQLAVAKQANLLMSRNKDLLRTKFNGISLSVTRIAGDYFGTAFMDADTKQGIDPYRNLLGLGKSAYRLGLSAMRLHIRIHAGISGKLAERMSDNRFFRFVNKTRKGQWNLVKRGGFLEKPVRNTIKAAAKGAVKGTTFAARQAGRGAAKGASVAAHAIAASPRVTEFIHEHPSIEKANDSIYNARQSAKEAHKRALERDKARRKKRIDSKRKRQDFTSRLFAPARKAGDFFGRVREWASAVLRKILIAVFILIIVFVLLYLFVNFVLSSIGESTSLVNASVMDYSKDEITTVLDNVYGRLGEHISKAKDIINGSPADIAPSFTEGAEDLAGERHEISKFGHPANYAAGNTQETSQGYDGADYSNIVFIRKDAEQEVKNWADSHTGTVKIGDFNKYNKALENDTSRAYGQVMTNADDMIAIATAMMENQVKHNKAQRDALLQDLDKIMNPDPFTAVSGIYPAQYAGTETITYYCNNRDGHGGRSHWNDQQKNYSGYFDTLSSEGGAVYDETGMIYGEFTGDDNAADFIDTTEWHTSENEAGCEFDQEAYARDSKAWKDAEPDGDDKNFYYEDAVTGTKTFNEDAYNEAVEEWNNGKPEQKDYYYCPGHEATVSYGNRDVAVYVPVYTLQDVESDPDFVAEIQASEHYDEYKDLIKDFIRKNGFQQEDASAGNYKEIAETYLDGDWMELYGESGETFYNNAYGQVSSSGYYTPATDPYHLNEGDMTTLGEATGGRADVVSAAESFLGRGIHYYMGGKPSSAVFGENHFGSLVKPDYKGRNVRGLDCSGFVDFVYWQVGIYPVCRGGGTGGVGYLPEFYDPKKLQPGDLGMHHSAASGLLGGGNHIGIFKGWNASGQQVWIACGSHGVCEYATNEFHYFYDVGGLLN